MKCKTQNKSNVDIQMIFVQNKLLSAFTGWPVFSLVGGVKHMKSGVMNSGGRDWDRHCGVGAICFPGLLGSAQTFCERLA